MLDNRQFLVLFAVEEAVTFVYLFTQLPMCSGIHVSARFQISEYEATDKPISFPKVQGIRICRFQRVGNM